VHDEDDLLDPENTIKRYKAGIDVEYLVRHFGGELLYTSVITQD
jgi:hypothetical protein